jgi:hypothetical protein
MTRRINLVRYIIRDSVQKKITEEIKEVAASSGSGLIVGRGHALDAVLDEVTGTGAAVLLGEVAGFLCEQVVVRVSQAGYK